MQVFGISDVGMKRALNEDNFSAGIYDGILIALVCDGMGGANAGEVASKIACTTFVDTALPKLRESKDKDEFDSCVEETIHMACAEANTAVYTMSQSSAELEGMGTTLSGCIIYNGTVWTFNVGDSRVYHITDKEARQLTTDHSYVQELVNNGMITEEEALTHPNRNIILRALGVKESIECDVCRFDELSGYYLVCSDGMSNYFEEKEVAAIATAPRLLSQRAQELVDFANARGGMDNITVVLIDTEITNGGKDEH